MSRRSYRPSEGLLLDTSFLLPIMGFEASERVMSAFRRLRDYELYYNDISVLEALWKIVKVIKGSKDEITRIAEGVRALRETLKYAAIDEDALKRAVYMYKTGHRDIIDNLLYSIAVSRGLKLLTVDEELIEFVARNGLPRDALTTPEELE